MGSSINTEVACQARGNFLLAACTVTQLARLPLDLHCHQGAYGYESAKARYAPFDRLQDPTPTAFFKRIGNIYLTGHSPAASLTSPPATAIAPENLFYSVGSKNNLKQYHN